MPHCYTRNHLGMRAAGITVMDDRHDELMDAAVTAVALITRTHDSIESIERGQMLDSFNDEGSSK